MSLTDIVAVLGDNTALPIAYQLQNVAFLESDANGIPSNHVHATLSISTSIIPSTNPVAVTFTPDLNVRLSANTNYWLVLAGPFQGSFPWDYTNTPNPSLPLSATEALPHVT